MESKRQSAMIRPFVIQWVWNECGGQENHWIKPHLHKNSSEHRSSGGWIRKIGIENWREKYWLGKKRL